MRTNYILIDYQNVQPKDPAVLNRHPFELKVFRGANQPKLSFDLASALQPLGDKVEYIRIEGSGKNNLDFHIAFYIGQIAERDKNAFFHIISKDKGFDPLIAHLKTKNIYARRSTDFSEIPLLKVANGMSPDEKIDHVVDGLRQRGDHRPRKVKGLANTIGKFFMDTLDDAEVQRLIEHLRQRKIVRIENEKVSYDLQGAKS